MTANESTVVTRSEEKRAKTTFFMIEVIIAETKGKCLSNENSRSITKGINRKIVDNKQSQEKKNVVPTLVTESETQTRERNCRAKILVS